MKRTFSRDPGRLRRSYTTAAAGAALALLVGLVAAPSANSDTPPAESSDAPVVHGLKGEYYAMSEPGARDFAELGGTALDPNIDFQSLGSIFEGFTGQTEHTTARWTGEIEAPASEAFTFSATGDNGFRLWVDGDVVIDHWVGDWDNEQHSEPVELTEGERYDIKLEYFQDVGGTNMHLSWASDSTSKQIIPTSAFYPPEDFEVFPVSFAVDKTGLLLRAAFGGDIKGVEDLKDHLVIKSDTTPMPISAIAVDSNDPRAILVSLDAPISSAAKVRVMYDGEGNLSAGGQKVPEISRAATNGSTHEMMTPWGENLDENNPLPEYPRPQLVRKEWKNLNGPWEFAAVEEGESPQFGKKLDEEVIVPFAIESKLSGIERHEDHMFYRKLVDIPQNWTANGKQRIKLNFGAVDYDSTVWVNGTKVAENTGGYHAFSADITDALKEGGTVNGKQEIIVAVTDTTGVGNDQATGKQTPNPGGIMYTAVSGIWQTVWLEPVAPASIDQVVSTPDLNDNTIKVNVKSSSASPDARVKVKVRDAEGDQVAMMKGDANTELSIPIPEPHLWTPDDPYLYDLDIQLKDGASKDKASSYFGMRSVGLKEINGFTKIVLNGEPIYSLAMLDQGYFPDGLYTAPSDEALSWDIKAQKNLGFNAIRKHIKVEPARWYYHADRLGMLVWQDFVSGTFNTKAGQEKFVKDGHATIDQLRSHPSIIGWVVFNEGWGEWDREATGRLAEEFKAADPSRLLNAHSGVNCCASKGDSGKGDILDHHDYTNTDPPPPSPGRASMDGEHGGFNLRTPGHMWPGAPANIYSDVESKKALTDKYVANTETYYLSQAKCHISGSVYTQVTDLENEINGFYTYDRRVTKVNVDRIREVNERVLAAGASVGQPTTNPGTPGLDGISYWPLNEGTGSTSEDAVADSDLTLVGGAEWAEGKYGNGLKFNGDGQYAETKDAVLDTTGSYSVSAWVKLDELPGNYFTAVSQDGGGKENPFYLQYGQGGFKFSLPNGQRATESMTPELGEWYHLTGVRDASTNALKLYINGELVDENTVCGGVGSSGPLSIGRAKWGGANTDFWNGSIDEVRAFDRALSDAEVKELAAKK